MRGQHKEEPPAGTTLVDVPGGGPGTGSVRARLVLLPVSAPVAPCTGSRRSGPRASWPSSSCRPARRRSSRHADAATSSPTSRRAVSPPRTPRTGPRARLQARQRPAPAGRDAARRRPLPGGGWAVLARAVAEELASVGVPVLLGVRPVEAVSPCCWACVRSPSARRSRTGSRRPSGRAWSARACSGRGAAARGGGRGRGRLGGGLGGPAARGGDGDGRAGPDGPPWYDARRLDTDLLLWRLRDHPDLAAFVERAIGPSATTTSAPSRRCCPPSRRTWRTRAARRRRPASCT